MITFPISGVETYWWLPLAVTFVLASLTSMGGVSGAFLLLPFQISVLGFTSPAVSSTNFIYNTIAIPSGVARYYCEKRMVWPLAGTLIAGYLPGIFLGAFIRVNYLPDPTSFKLFAGMVLLYVGIRLTVDLFRRRKASQPGVQNEIHFKVTDVFLNLKRFGYVFNGEGYAATTLLIATFSMVVGIIGGAYGIGGGAIMAPLLVAMFRLPVHTIAGATLLGTFVSSLAGVASYTIIASMYSGGNLPISPDWMLGGMFGLGGAVGMYVGARLQRYVPAIGIKALLSGILLYVAGKYILQFFV